MRTATVTIAAIALALGACGGKQEERAPGDAASTGEGATTASRAADNDAVAAVQSTPGTPVARLHFVIESRPVAGQPFVVRLLVSAAEPQPELHLAAESSTLTIQPRTAVLALDTAAGAVTHTLTVTAGQAGLAEISVRLKAGAAETPYAIPVLVLEG